MIGPVVKRSEALAWETPASSPHQRRFGLYFERDVTPTTNMAVGYVLLPRGEEQPKLSSHDGTEEVYYVVRGHGAFVLDDRTVDLEPGTAVYVAPGVKHRALNTGSEELDLLWMNTPPPFGRIGGYVDAVDGWTRIPGSVSGALSGCVL